MVVRGHSKVVWLGCEAAAAIGVSCDANDVLFVAAFGTMSAAAGSSRRSPMQEECLEVVDSSRCCELHKHCRHRMGGGWNHGG